MLTVGTGFATGAVADGIGVVDPALPAWVGVGEIEGFIAVSLVTDAIGVTLGDMVGVMEGILL